MRWRTDQSALPGFAPAMGFTLFWLAAIVVLPLGGLVASALTTPPARALAILLDPRSLAAFRLSFGAAALAALIDAPLGLLLAWVLVRYRFPGRGVLDALVDLPFALPTSVAGIALTTLYVPDGWLGTPLAWLGVEVAYTPLGVVAALCFVGFPFLVRTIQPVLAALDVAAEEAALTLGARPYAILWRVILPPLAPALLTGLGLAFARGVGEYGSVIFIAGNRPAVSEILPLLIVVRLEQFDTPGAAVLGTAMLVVSLLFLLGLSRLRRELSHRVGQGHA